MNSKLILWVIIINTVGVVLFSPNVSHGEDNLSWKENARLLTNATLEDLKNNSSTNAAFREDFFTISGLFPGETK